MNKRAAGAIIAMIAAVITIFGFVTGDFSLPQLFAGSSSPTLTPTSSGPTATLGPTATPAPTYLMNIGYSSGQAPAYGLAIITGAHYPRSVRYKFAYNCCSTSLSSVFSLDRRFRHFRATIGIEDGPTCSTPVDGETCAVEFDLYADTVRVYAKTVAYTDAGTPIDLDLQQLLGRNPGSITLSMTSTGNFFVFAGWASWGDAIVS
jgi:hypothetical protein